MTNTPTTPSYAEVEAALLGRWPESRLEPSLDRIQALTELLGDPQRAYPVIHLTGTNGKTSTARMIDALVRARGLRTGRFTSPHVESMTERISVDGEPLILSVIDSTCGLVNRPVRRPTARSRVSIIRDVLVFPFVPVRWMTG